MRHNDSGQPPIQHLVEEKMRVAILVVLFYTSRACTGTDAALNTMQTDNLTWEAATSKLLEKGCTQDKSSKSRSRHVQMKLRWQLLGRKEIFWLLLLQMSEAGSHRKILLEESLQMVHHTE